jgi:hypothetical protein
MPPQSKSARSKSAAPKSASLNSAAPTHATPKSAQSTSLSRAEARAKLEAPYAIPENVNRRSLIQSFRGVHAFAPSSELHDNPESYAVLPPRTRMYISSGVLLVSLAGIVSADYLEKMIPPEPQDRSLPSERP